MNDTSPSLQACQQALGYPFADPELLRFALTHASSADQRSLSNERLEFLGDAVLGLVVCQSLFERYPHFQEGELTKIKSAVVSRRICAIVARRLGLQHYLTLGKGMDGGEHMPSSMAAGALEAVIAAVYLDGGLDAARTFILSQLESEIHAAAESEHRYNYKSQLQQFAQQTFSETPYYELLDEKGPDHSKCFEVAVSVGARRFGSAWGPSKKEAEQKAALLALVELGELDHEVVPD